MYRTCVQHCQSIRDSSAVPINHSTILYERLTRSVYSTPVYFPVHGCPLCLYDPPKPQVFSPDVFTIQLLSTTVRQVDTAEALFPNVMIVLFSFPTQWVPTQVQHNAVCGHHTAVQRTKTQEYALPRLEHAIYPNQSFLVLPAYKTPLHTIT